MPRSSIVRSSLGAFVVAVSLAPSALAAAPRPSSGLVPRGEAKNEPPFTARYSADPGYEAALRAVAAMSSPPRTVGGEAKNTPPFTRPVTGGTGIIVSRPGFSWLDAGIGAAGAIGLCLLLAGAALFVRRPPVALAGAVTNG
jgi:hypothetical protein